MTKDETIAAAELMMKWARGECEVECRRIDTDDPNWYESGPVWDFINFDYRERPLSLREKVMRLDTHMSEIEKDFTVYVDREDVLELIDAT